MEILIAKFMVHRNITFDIMKGIGILLVIVG